MGFTSSIPRALTAPAVVPTVPAFPITSDICPHCVVSLGLCGREDCRRQVLPQLAKPTGLLRLIGEAHVEQKGRQESYVPSSLSMSPEQQRWRERKEKARNSVRAAARKHARAVARSQRRGNFGLAKAIMEHKAAQ